MIEWALVLTPLLVLPVVLLFRFVGCAEIAGLKEPDALPPQIPLPKVPNYRDYIMGKSDNPGSVLHPEVQPDAADITGYWRLVDGAASMDAIDEKGLRKGTYRTSTDSDTVPGDFIANLPSLIYSAPHVSSRFFNGGYVVIPADDHLYTDEFTIEAWVLPGFTGTSEHTLFHAGGHYRAPLDHAAAYHGFRIYATDARCWQVILAPGGAVFSSPPLIPPGDTLTHLAVTVQKTGAGAAKTVTIFIDGKQTVQQTVGFYSRPDGAPLLIGVMGDQGEPSDLVNLALPNVKQSIRSRIQEVVLHRKALSQAEIENHVDINR